MTEDLAGAEMRVASVRLGAEPWPKSLTSMVADVVGVLAGAAAGRLMLVLVEEPTEPEQAGAAREALRMLVHASVLERPELQVNLLVGGSGPDRDRTLAYLSSNSADFVLGATVDLGVPG